MTYEIALREVPEQPIVSIRERVSESDMPGFIGRCYGQLYSRLGSFGVTPSGPPMVIYHAFGPDLIDAEVCVPVDMVVPTPAPFVSRALPATHVASTLHVGPYNELGKAYDALNEWITQHEYQASDPVYVRYLTQPGRNVPESEYQTIIEMPIVATAVPVA